MSAFQRTGHAYIEDRRRLPCTDAPDPRCECGLSAYECPDCCAYQGPDEPDEWADRGLTWVERYQNEGRG